MNIDTDVQFYIFRKKLLLIQFYRNKNMGFEDIAYITRSRTEIVRTYCMVLLNEK